MKKTLLLIPLILLINACGQMEAPPLPIDAENFSRQQKMERDSVVSKPQQPAPTVTKESATQTISSVPAETGAPVKQQAPGKSDDAVEEQQLQQVPAVIDESDGGSEVADMGTANSLTHDQSIRLSMEQIVQGNLAEAINTLKQAIEKYPTSAQLYALRSDVYRQYKNSEAAMADINVAIELNSESAPYLVGRAQLNIAENRMTEAEADLSRAIEIEPDLVAAYFNRGTLYAHLGKYEQALQDLDACIARTPMLAAPYYNRGSVLERLGRRQEAIVAIERFIELSEDEEWKQLGRKLLAEWQ